MCQSALSGYVNSSTSLQSGSLNNTMTCSQVPTTYSSSQMTCNVVAQLVQSLFPGDTTLTITRTLNDSLVPGGSAALTQAGLTGGDGQVYAQLWYDGVEQFYCQANECDQNVKQDGGSVNGSTWTCQTLNCTCRPGADFCGRNTVVSVHEVQLDITYASLHRKTSLEPSIFSKGH